MKKINLVCFICILIMFFGCKSKEKETPMFNLSNPHSELIHKALEEGDTNSYYELSLDYMDSPYKGFLYTALIMANKHHYHQAYMDVYDCLTDLAHKETFTELEKLDDETILLALKYLIKGAEAGNEECIRLLDYYFNEEQYIPFILKIKAERVDSLMGVE